MTREPGPLDGGWVVVAVGGALLVGALANFLRELRTVSALLPPTAALATGGLLAVGVAAVGYRAVRTPHRRGDAWRIAGWCVAGLGVGAALAGVTIAVKLGEGRVVSDPALDVLLAGSGGALAGALLGTVSVYRRAARREARRSRRSLQLLNSLLRHELLNGLTIVRGHAALLRESATDVEDHATVIEERSDEMAALVRDIRPVAEAFGADPDLRPVDLSSVLAGRIEHVREAYPDAEVTADVPEDLVVRGTEAVSHIFENLLVNAVQHNDGDRPRVAVSAERSEDAVRVHVSDDGPGIPESEREGVFDGPDRGDEGVGLFIVDALVEQYGGAVRVGDSEMGGARFVVSLPTPEGR